MNINMNMNNDNIVIVGGGIIGISIAYYLSKRRDELDKNTKIIVCEATKVANAASGKAGGFLASWSQNTPMNDLCDLSFTMHEELAIALDEYNYDYRKLNALAIETSMLENRKKKYNKNKNVELPEWINKNEIITSSILATKDTAAQVHPYKLTHVLKNIAERNGVIIKEGCEINGLLCEEMNDDNLLSICGVKCSNGEVISSSKTILAMGPWTSVLAKEWLRKLSADNINFPDILPEIAFSITMRLAEEKNDIFEHALFLELTDKEGNYYNPEVYPRPDGEIYCCSTLNNDFGDVPLLRPELVKSNDQNDKALYEIASHVAKLKEYKIDKSQACFLPYTDDSCPVMGPINNTTGLFVCSGHMCWGILTSLSSGLLMSELLLDGKTSSLSIEAFNPHRFAKK